MSAPVGEAVKTPDANLPKKAATVQNQQTERIIPIQVIKSSEESTNTKEYSVPQVMQILGNIQNLADSNKLLNSQNT